jgi:hypothetical protein
MEALTRRRRKQRIRPRSRFISLRNEAGRGGSLRGKGILEDCRPLCERGEVVLCKYSE